MMNLAAVAMKMGILDIAIAGFVLKWKNAINIGIAILPPPVPAI